MAGKKKPIQMNANYRKSELLLETGQIDVPGSGGEGKTYEGIAPIQVDNTNDQIGIDLTNIQAKLTAGQNITIDENNVISASGGEGHEYTGVAPIVVDNTNETVGVTMDAIPTAGSSNPVTSDGINQTFNTQSGALIQYVDNQVSGKADKNKFNTVAGYQVYTEGTPADIPVATTAQLATKQDKLTAGSNIAIDANNVISAIDTKYTAGTNVQISSSNVISATDTKYTAGTNVQISSSNVISATDTKAGIQVTDYGVAAPPANAFQNGDIIEIDLPTINQSVSSASSWTASLGGAGIGITGGSCSTTVRVRITNGTQTSKIPIQLELFMNGTNRAGLGIVYFMTPNDFLNKLNAATTSTDMVFVLGHHAFNGAGLVTANAIQVTKQNWLTYVMGCRRYRKV